MPSTYEPIATTTLVSAQSSVTIGSGGTIPQTYTDLVVVFNGTNATGDDGMVVQFNGDTASNYSSTLMYGNGSTSTSGRIPNSTTAHVGRSGSVNSTTIFSVMNYTNATTFKTVIGRGNVSNGLVIATVALWRKTPEAVTSIKIMNESGQNFSVGSTFTLYGIKAA